MTIKELDHRTTNKNETI